MDDDEKHGSSADLGEYKLSRCVSGHSGDVKCLVQSSTGSLISGSRDATVRIWTERGGDYSESVQLPQAGRLQVNSLAFFRAPTSSSWMIFAGRKDGSIAVFTSADPQPSALLHEHKNNVCTLYVDSKMGRLLSGSWDNNAIVWPIEQIGSSEFTALGLTGHNMSVWAVTTVVDTPDHYLTGSADRTIKLWQHDQQLRTYKGHKDVVRAILSLSSTRFLSCSNDGSLLLWDIASPTPVSRFDSIAGTFIYSMALSPLTPTLHLVATCGEGGLIELWLMDGDFRLTPWHQLQTPVESLWALVLLANGDIAAGGSDGNIWLFSRVAQRQASQEERVQFDQRVAQRVADTLERSAARDNRDTGGEVIIKVALDDGQPNLELKYTKGSDPGVAAEKFIQDNHLPISYLSEIVEYIKANVPEARETQLPAKRKATANQHAIFEGKEYDFVFEVTVDDGRRLSLAFNKGDDPDWTAQQFCERHHLPIKFMAKVANLLRSQTTESSSSLEYADPFTGTGRYVPQANGTMDASSNGASIGDPLTGAGRYVPGESTAPYIPLSSASSDRKRPQGEFIPVHSFYRFGIEQSSQKAMIRLRELNDSHDDCQLSPGQLQALDEIMTGKVESVRDEHVTALARGLSWSIGICSMSEEDRCSESIVPVLDVLRIALLAPDLNALLCTLQGGSDAFGLVILRRMNALLVSEPADAIRILVCRAVANAAVHESGRRMLMHDPGSIFPLIVASFASCKSALQIAAASALANWSRILLDESRGVSELGPREDALRAIISRFGDEHETDFAGYSHVALLRFLQAIATFMWGDATVIRLAKGRNMAALVERIKDMSGDEAVKAVARDIIGMTDAV